MTTSQVAIVFPALLFWIMLIVQYGLWYHAKQVTDTVDTVVGGVLPKKQ